MKISSIATAGGTTAVGVGNGVAVLRDGGHLLVFDGVPGQQVAAARDTVACAGDGKVVELALSKNAGTDYAVSDVAGLGFLEPGSDDPRLVVIASGSAVYAAVAGTLRRLKVPDAATAVAVDDARVWAVAGGTLYVNDKGVLYRARVPERGASAVFAAQSGVWVSNGTDTVEYALEVPNDPAWQSTIAPIVQRACAPCHVRGGESGVDLTSSASWQAERAAIVDRVITTRTMPPPGTELSLEDRSTLETWLASASAR